ncbi:ABC-F family ATP-binding cassette domain-containing protein [Taibaiella lutea]|uniref:ABC-F family ATP-binding cassette domain-containing protein n=1 Tax=Taibaiella lutea TaxID=2608001 RepID=A0A5M6CP88_9BACT|nr:ABC-F family ATP-binding cassette domain-containing protein [Taibaiella lutea]KAA5535055.1 ABC-F family ATP-binding cassette domain-containing protein [Taibaiella lutea]
MLILQNIIYRHPDKDLLFDNIHLNLRDNDKVALTGNNGVGKSTLLKIIAGTLQPAAGQINAGVRPFYVPQLFGQYNHLTIAEALGIEVKLHALKAILEGNVTEANMNMLEDDWTIEERCNEAMEYWQLKDLDLTQKMETLSGGHKTKVFLASISIHQPKLVLLDEPSNHLDIAGRELLYDFISSASCSIIVVSHDRKLLNLLNTVFELTKKGITVYGGNYDFYAAQKLMENNALEQDVKNKEKALRKEKEKERETLERQQKLDARGKKKQEKAGIPTIAMNTLRNNAEKSTAKIKGVHAEKIGDISRELQALRKEIPDIDKMKFGFDDSSLHTGKVLFTARDLNFSYNNHMLWKENLNLQINSGERIALKGLNGSGKTTLIKIMLGKLEPATGTVFIAADSSVYIDQDYSLVDNKLSVYEQAQQFNTAALEEHEIKIRLHRFLFTREDWNKPIAALSGGEKMRLMLCCLTISNQSPDIIILDEPTNNLDIQNIEILTAAINEYKGTLIVVSHDEYFLEQINAKRTIYLH